MEDISNGFFDTIKGMSNLRYFNGQHVALDHRMEKRDLNMALHDDDKVTMEGDAIDEATYFNMNIHCTILRNLKRNPFVERDKCQQSTMSTLGGNMYQI